MPGSRPIDRAPTLVAIVLVLALAAQCLGSMRLKSATFDEPIYMTAGVAALTTGVDLNPAHPPLMKYLIAIPLVLIGSTPVAALPGWERAAEIRRTYTLTYLFENRVDADTLLFASRCAVVAVSLLLSVLVWAWARRLYGPWAGVVALGLYCFNPDVITHSSLATLDLGLAAGITAASYAFWRAYTTPSPWTGVVAGIALAAAALVKAPALLLLACIPLELGAAIARVRGRRSATTATTALVRTTVIALAVAAGVVAVAYGPHRFGLADYAAGFRLGFFNRDAFMSETYEFFAWGRYSATGFPWYFLAAFLVKAPIPLLVGTIAVVAWLVRRPTEARFDELFLVLPAAAFFVATLFIKDALGVRYLLPAYPALFVLIGGLTVDVLRRAHAAATSPWPRRLATSAVAGLAAVYVGGTLWIYPDHLAFFNGLLCGPGDGIRWLDDSNIDIGQDFKQLAAYLHEHDIPSIRGVYNPMHFVPYVTRYYGVEFEWMTLDEIHAPSPGWYAVSTQLLQRPSLSKERDIRFDWLDRFEPVAKIGYSIYLYRFE